MGYLARYRLKSSWACPLRSPGGRPLRSPSCSGWRKAAVPCW